MSQELDQKSSKSDVKLRFGEVVSLFQAYLGLPAEPVETRLRLLRRAGVPMLGEMSTGPARHYGLPELLQLAFALEFIEEGVSIAQAAAVLRRFWSINLARAPDRAWRASAKGSKEAILVILYRTSFRGWTTDNRKADWYYITRGLDDGRDYSGEHCIEVLTASEFAGSAFLKPGLELPTAYGRHRAYIINCTKMSSALAKLLHAQFAIDTVTMQFLYARYRVPRHEHVQPDGKH